MVALRRLILALGVLIDPGSAQGNVIGSGPGQPPAPRPEQVQDTARIELRAVEAQPNHPITLEDIVALRDVHEPHLSPDGRRVAFVVRQGFRSCNCYHTALYVLDTATHSVPRKLVEETALSEPAHDTPERYVRWTPDGTFISYLSARGGSVQLWGVSPDGGPPRELLRHGATPDRTRDARFFATGERRPVGVLSYEWSPDGRRVAFTAQPPTDSQLIAQVAKAGVIYDERSTMGFADLVAGRGGDIPTEVWVYDLATQHERRLWQTLGPIGSLAWSPDGSRLAVSYEAPLREPQKLPASYNTDLGVLSLADGTFTPIVASDTASETDPAWSPDGRQLAFYSRTDAIGSSFGIINVSSGARQYLAHGAVSDWGLQSRAWWRADGKELLFSSEGLGNRRERGGLYTVSLKGGAVQRLTSPDLSVSECDDPTALKMVCIVQSSNVPPAPALVQLVNGAAHSLAEINPELSHIILGKVKEVRWRNRYKAETNGYLLRPLDYRPGTRYPLLIIAYGFGGNFVTRAEWLTSYPAQVFAQHGFVVLMVNYPRWREWAGNDFARGSVAWGYGPLASVEAAVGLLVREGLVDSQRVGMMGTSFGGTMTEMALTHSDLLRAAVTTNGSGAFTPLAYSLRRPLAVLYEHVLGGPPWGSTLKHWLDFSPMYNAYRVRAPVLMEFNPNEAVVALETFSAFRRHGVPVELVVYPAEAHVIMQPEHRLASMQRILDWFDFWLHGREDPDPSRRAQYARWHEMQAGLDSLKERSRSPTHGINAGQAASGPT